MILRMIYCENSSRNFSGDFSRSTSRNFSRNHPTNSTGNSSRSSSRIFFWKYLKEYLRKDLWEFLCECSPDRGEFLKKFFQKLPGSAISAQYYSLFFRIKSNRTWYALVNRCHRGRTHANPNKFANEANIWLLFALIVILLGRSPTGRSKLLHTRMQGNGRVLRAKPPLNYRRSGYRFERVVWNLIFNYLTPSVRSLVRCCRRHRRGHPGCWVPAKPSEMDSPSSHRMQLV